MYEHLRAQIQQRMAAGQAAIAQAIAGVQAAQGVVTAAVSEVAAAEAAAAGAQSVLDGANGVVGAAQASLDQARVRKSSADSALSEWLDEEPDRTGPTGKPNPGWAAWNRKRAQLQTAAGAAGAAVVTAQDGLNAAVATRDRAAAERAAAQGRVDRARGALAQAQNGLAQANAAVVAAQAALAPMQAELAALDARAARILAEPLQVDDVDRIAEEELASALARRHDRQAQYGRRVALAQDRAATLVAQDATADELAGLAVAIRAWPEIGRFPDLAGVAALLEALAAASRAQRALPPAARTDDVRGATTALADALRRVQAAASAATAERDRWSAQLQADADALAVINSDAPPR